MPVKCKNITRLMDMIAPPSLASSWDNVGLLIGDEEAFVSSLLISLDVNHDVIDEAVESGSNLIITHHPVIFSPIKSLNVKNYRENMIHRIIYNKINVFSAHTNLDASQYGINDFLAKKLGLRDVELLEKSYSEKLYKIAVYVPQGYEDRVRDAMISMGAGSLGNYRGCTFSTEGTGTFMPLEGSAPFIGKKGVMEYVKETRIETIASSDNLDAVVDSMLKAHPYEEVAYDVFSLLKCEKEYGFGRIGYLKSPVSLETLCNVVKQVLHIDSVDVTGPLHKEIKKVAICSGSGGDFIKRAYDAGCDAYITGDIKYHQACDARDMGLSLIDGGHFATENIYMAELYNYMKEQLSRKNYDVNIILSKKNSNPYIKV